jgi:hypothetical protein
MKHYRIFFIFIKLLYNEYRTITINVWHVLACIETKYQPNARVRAQVELTNSLGGLGVCRSYACAECRKRSKERHLDPEHRFIIFCNTWIPIWIRTPVRCWIVFSQSLKVKTSRTPGILWLFLWFSFHLRPDVPFLGSSPPFLLNFCLTGFVFFFLPVLEIRDVFPGS